MNSKVAEAIGLQTHAVALNWADSVPEGATCFKPGRWGCVMGLFAAAATKARVGAVDRQTYGCWGGGVGLGFGNCYESFPGGIECFHRFLSDGNEKTERGRAVGSQLAATAGARMAEEFLLGERYLKGPEVTRRFLENTPITDIPAQCVVIKPLDDVNPEKEDVKSVTFFVDPDQLSALVVLANYADPAADNVIIPWAAGCQVIGIFGYRELERAHPRALVGMTDLSARATVRPSLGRNIMSFTAPWPLFLEMEQHVEGSFLQRHTWQGLRDHN
jgi:hypothetical protein